MIEKHTETQDEISRALFLANGGVSFAINAEKTAARSFSRSTMPFFYSGDLASTHTNHGTVISSHTGSPVNVSAVYPLNDLPAISNDSRFLVQSIDVPVSFSRSVSGNFSDAVWLNHKSGQLPEVLQSSANAGVNVFPLPVKISVGIGKGPAFPAVSMHEDGDAAADHAKTDPMPSPNRNLVLSASEKENIKTYQLGGETSSEVLSGDYAVSGKWCCHYSLGGSLISLKHISNIIT